MKLDTLEEKIGGLCRSPHGERGLKFLSCTHNYVVSRRSPHGERGLKYASPSGGRRSGMSLPSRGAWIEIPIPASSPTNPGRSLPSRGAWIKMELLEPLLSFFLSRSPQGERGLKSPFYIFRPPAVGRSPHGERGLKLDIVDTELSLHRSLPSRGAWIEIGDDSKIASTKISRSPHGERGLKSALGCSYPPTTTSLPSRGAWIEICSCRRQKPPGPGRSPHGERGLKFLPFGSSSGLAASLPSRGAWIEIAVGTAMTAVGGSRSPHGERGLKSDFIQRVVSSDSVAPLTGSVD